jgi:Fic family protein
MLFRAPSIEEPESAVLDRIGRMRGELRWQLHEPKRWVGALRRQAFARNIQASNSIEGYDADLADVAAIAVGHEPLEADTQTRLAIEGYRNAMTYVLQLADEDDFSYTTQLLKSLHFMMTSHDLVDRPGRWRLGTVYVRAESTGQIVHEGVDVEQVSPLMEEIVDVLNTEPEVHPIVRAAMAHLNLVMIHPFKDGNGRMGRCLQSLVLARNGTLAPVFMSIEEYLGQHTPDYYDVLARTGGGRWQPDRATRSWLHFVLTAHLRQATTLQYRVKVGERLWLGIERFAQTKGLPDRCLPSVFDVASGFGIRNATYRAVVLDANGDDITEGTASRDLRDLVRVGLFAARGEKRGRTYSAAPDLRAILQEAQEQTAMSEDDLDPFGSGA